MIDKRQLLNSLKNKKLNIFSSAGAITIWPYDESKGTIYCKILDVGDDMIKVEIYLSNGKSHQINYYAMDSIKEIRT